MKAFLKIFLNTAKERNIFPMETILRAFFKRENLME